MTDRSSGWKLRARAALLCAAILSVSGSLHGQASDFRAAVRPDTSVEVRCVDLPPGTPRPAFGCFNLAHLSGLTFADTLVVWRLYRFPSVAAAEAARSPRGSVAEAEGAAWLSEVPEAGVAPARSTGGVLITTSAPMPLTHASSYAVSWAYGVFRTGMRSRVHVHAGPEAFHVLAGAQCVETPAGVVKTVAGATTFLPGGIPMELTTSGTDVRKAFALVVHDAAHPQAEAASWRATGLCNR